jgi:precorrin-6A/cobalt-precorrin-6A reductase
MLESRVGMAFNVLILGGTSEGRVLSQRLASEPRYHARLSLAGRTASLRRPDVPHRVGGFGGALGLCEYLVRERIDALIDTTHAFAAQISANAVQAARATGTPLVRLARSAWLPVAGDAWQEVSSMQAAVEALGTAPRRVFLSIGRKELAAFEAAPQHTYLIRAVDPFEPSLRRAKLIAERGPFHFDAELALLEREQIEVLVSKNSGTDATYPKLAAARALQLPVIMVQRPVLPAAAEAPSLDAIVSWLERLAHERSAI